MHFILGLALICTFSYAQEGDFQIDSETAEAIPKHAGEVLIVKGEASLISKNEETKLTKGARLFPKDQIKTTKRSFVKVRMVDDTIMNLGPNTHMDFKKFEYKSKTNRVALFNFVKGQIRAIVPNKVSEGSINVETKSTAMAVRGTTLLSNVFDKDGMEVTQYAVLEGKIQVDNKINQKSYEVNTSDHYVVLNKDNDPNLSEDGVFMLPPEEFRRLKAQGQDESKIFNPLLDLYKRNTLKADASGSQESSSEQSDMTKRPVKKKNWKKELKKLNNALKENNSDE